MHKGALRDIKLFIINISISIHTFPGILYADFINLLLQEATLLASYFTDWDDWCVFARIVASMLAI